MLQSFFSVSFLFSRHFPQTSCLPPSFALCLFRRTMHLWCINYFYIAAPGALHPIIISLFSMVTTVMPTLPLALSDLLYGISVIVLSKSSAAIQQFCA